MLVARRVTADDGADAATATAAPQSVAEQYQSVAAIEPVTRAQVAFPMSGTVRSVDVTVGDTVAIGETLASVDTAALEEAVRQAESTLAAAQLTLNIALSGRGPLHQRAAGRLRRRCAR